LNSCCKRIFFYSDKVKYLALYVLCFYFICGSAVNAQTTSNEGLDFWAVFPTHVPAGPSALAEMSIYITSQNNSSGTVSIGDLSIPFVVNANEIVEVPINYARAYIDFNQSNTVLKNKAIHILVNAGQPKVAIFAFISAARRSEAYLVLPKEAMGQLYFAIGQDGISVPAIGQNLNAGVHYLIVTATEPNTNIIITKPDKTVISKLLPDAGDVFQLTDDHDFSGTKIESVGCTKFAAYSGHSGIAYDLQPQQDISYDPLIQQLYPTQSWGKRYGLIPFLDRNYFYKVLAAEDGTEVSINGVLKANLNAGESYLPAQLPITEPLLLTANKQVTVAQFAYSQRNLSADGSNNQVGDPDMVILNPEEYNIKNITLFASFDRTPEFYLNVFMKTSGTGTFKINGLPARGKWKLLASNPDYSYAQIKFTQFNLEKSSLTLSADEGFNAMAYGFGEVESYAYSAGTNLAVNNYLKLTNINANVTNTNACINEPLVTKVVLPARAKSLVWTFEDPSLNFTDNNPLGTPILNKEGKTQFKYEYGNGLIRFISLGTHTIKLLADLDPGTDTCPDDVGLKNYTYSFEITEPNFEVPDTVEILAGGTAKINGSSPYENLTFRWSPAFGLSDPNIVNPVVTAESTTTYALTAFSELGCSITKNVVVKVVDTYNVPNTFSPNGDGINDLWNLKLLTSYENSLVEIFNRYGQIVYAMVGYKVPFDGNFEGKPLPVGTYYYVIRPRNGKKNITGSLTIIR
jgi:gliding motility-associated-like protein